MALIKCPECGREISDKSKHCINCGFPLNEIEENINSTDRNTNNKFMCLIDGVQYDLSDIADILTSIPSGKLEDPDDLATSKRAWRLLQERVSGLTLFAVSQICGEIRNTRTVPETIDTKKYVFEPKKEDNLVHCPRCDSTQIVTGQRGYSMMWGFLGSNKTMNRCASCGYKWEPRKW